MKQKRIRAPKRGTPSATTQKIIDHLLRLADPNRRDDPEVETTTLVMMRMQRRDHPRGGWREAVTCLAAALEYAQRGFRVFPLRAVRDGTCTCQDWRDKNGKGSCPTPGKHPRFRNWQERASSDPSAVEEMWWNHKGSNVGIATGTASGVFVLDVDPKNGGEESLDGLVTKYGRIDTLQSVTGSGGKHFYFTHPGKPVKNGVALLPGLDTPPRSFRVGRRVLIRREGVDEWMEEAHLAATR